jgi:hypothetical protein
MRGATRLAKKGGQMADYHDTFDEGGRGMRTLRLVRIAGAVSSLAIVVSLGMWGYKLAVRNVMGVPVVRALEGAMRVAPVAPGGTVTAHQGLAVNDVAALGVATPLPDSLTLAPRPAELALDDVAGLQADDDGAVLTASAGLDDPATLALPDPDASPEAVALAMADIGGEAPARPAPVEVDSTAPAPAPAPAPDDAIAAAVAEAAAEAPDLAAPTGTIRPMRRPAGVVAVQPVPTVSDTQDVAAVVPVEVDPATLSIGAPLVQLGAFDTAEDARAEWAKLALRFPDLAGHAMVIQSATSGGTTFYRLRASGFDDADLSRKFCTDLLAVNAVCIPVAHR